MLKKGTIIIIVISVIMVFINSNTSAYANEVEQKFDMGVLFKLDEDLVELPINDLKKKDITVFKNEKR